MISVNGTLIVQMAAFMWAWWFIDSYLLRPLVACIAQEATAQQEIEMALEAQRQSVAGKDRYKRERWFHFQMLFSRATPSVGQQQIPCALTEKPEDAPLLDTGNKETLQNSTALLIKERIVNEF